jgi:TolB-like protein/Tfp pilus assembly protein PilF/DNA-binding winged helix-turn-helix (wHTH) protein
MGFTIQHGFRIGQLEVYPRYREIGGADGPVDLGQDAFSVLVALAERFPDIATVEELHRALPQQDPDLSSDQRDRLSRALDELTATLGGFRDLLNLIEVTEAGYRLTVPPEPADAVSDYAAGYDPYFVDDEFPSDHEVTGHGGSQAREISQSGVHADESSANTTDTGDDRLALRHLKVFVSSPGDVREERSIVRAVLSRLQEEIAGVATIEPVFWEEEPLLATDSFQAQILRPSDCDVMVAILWSRLGTPLPVDITRPDGSRYGSGTEFEFEDAVQGFREHGRPQLLVYRKTSAASVTLDDERSLLERVEQKKKLDAFVDHWFGSQEDGSLRAAYHAFESPEDFEHLVEEHLRKIVHRILPETEACKPRTSSEGEIDNEGGLIPRTIRDLRERRVFRVIFGYPVFAWVVLQVADVLANFMGVEARNFQPLLAVLIGGYPLAIFLSWLLQITRQGLVIHPSHKDSRGKLIPLRPLAGGVAAGVVAVAIGISSYAFMQRSPIEDCERTIAVLPFENFSPSPQNDYVGRGLAEEVLHLLTNIGNLRVASRTAAFSLDTTDLSMEDVGRRLGVCNILEGSVRREGDKLRITAQLIDTETGYHEWSDTYDRQIKDIFEVYDDIANAVVRALKITLTEDAAQKLAARPTESIEAYDHYLQARSMLARADDEGRFQRASHFFSRAVDIDPAFSRAWAGRCEAELGIYRFSRAVERIEQAESDCRQALSIDPDLVEVRIALTELYRISGQLDKADEEIRLALERYPADPDVFRALAWVRADKDDIEGAVRAYRSSIELAPEDVRAYQDLGRLLFAVGQYDASAKVYREMVDASGGSAASYNGLGAALLMQGNFDEAAAANRAVLERQPNPRAFSNAAVIYYHQGQFEEAELMSREAIALSPDDYRLVGNLADALRQIPGRDQEADEEYGRAAELAEGVRNINPDDVDALSSLGHFYAQLERMDSAKEAAEAALAAAPDDVYAHYYGALVWLESGDKQRALEELSTAIELGYSTAMLRADPQFDSLRGGPRFDRLVGKGR